MRLMTCREASQALSRYGITTAQIKRGCADGRYPHMRVGNRIVVDVDALAELLDQLGDLSSLISTAELAQRIGLSESTIRRAVSDGWMPYRVVGRNLRFDYDAVQGAIAARMQADTLTL